MQLMGYTDPMELQTQWIPITCHLKILDIPIQLPLAIRHWVMDTKTPSTILVLHCNFAALVTFMPSAMHT